MDETDTPDTISAEDLIRAWAECLADLEIELGLPRDQRSSRIEQLIVERNAELADAAKREEVATRNSIDNKTD